MKHEFRWFYRKGYLKPKIGVAGEAPKLQYRYLGMYGPDENDGDNELLWSEWKDVPFGNIPTVGEEKGE